MKRDEPLRRKLTKEIEFSLKSGQSLVVSLSMLGNGLDRIIVENEDGVVKVTARSGPAGGNFEFCEYEKEPEGSSHCTFWLGNQKAKFMIVDYLLSHFWGQFTWGKLIELHNNKRFVAAITRAAKKLAEEFESRAAEELNRLVPK